MVSLSKRILLNKFRDEYLTIKDLLAVGESLGEKIETSTAVWTMNNLIKSDEATRVGRGVYYMAPPREYKPQLSGLGRTVESFMADRFKYTPVILLDSAWLHGFMEQQPFMTTIAAEVDEAAIEGVISALKTMDYEAVPKNDFRKVEPYLKTSEPIIVTKSLRLSPATKIGKTISLAKLEKMLVDIVSEPEIYSQYQGWEMENIYINSIKDYDVNFS